MIWLWWFKTIHWLYHLLFKKHKKSLKFNLHVTMLLHRTVSINWKPDEATRPQNYPPSRLPPIYPEWKRKFTNVERMKPMLSVILMWSEINKKKKKKINKEYYYFRVIIIFVIILLINIIIFIIKKSIIIINVLKCHYSDKIIFIFILIILSNIET